MQEPVHSKALRPKSSRLSVQATSAAVPGLPPPAKLLRGSAYPVSLDLLLTPGRVHAQILLHQSGCVHLVLCIADDELLIPLCKQSLPVSCYARSRYNVRDILIVTLSIFSSPNRSSVTIEHLPPRTLVMLVCSGLRACIECFYRLFLLSSSFFCLFLYSSAIMLDRSS